MKKKKIVTVGELINEIAKDFERAHLYYGHGTDNAWDEAYFLLAGAAKMLDWDVEAFCQLSLLDFPLSKEQLLQLLNKRIVERQPVAYILGYTYFAGLRFQVNSKVLIPRSPFGELIVKQFQPWVNLKQLHRILDLCTGSGCMAIAAAKYCPHLIVDATDISLDALAIAKQNSNLNRVVVNFWQSDLFERIENKYDLIITNPPYVGKEELSNLPMEYLHEPGLAFLGGTKGEEMLVQIIEHAAHYLNENGQLIIEVGNSFPLIEKHFKIPFIELTFEQGDSEILLFEQVDLKKVMR